MRGSPTALLHRNRPFKRPSLAAPVPLLCPHGTQVSPVLCAWLSTRSATCPEVNQWDHHGFHHDEWVDSMIIEPMFHDDVYIKMDIIYIYIYFLCMYNYVYDWN